jgi:hypothetical protein
MKKFTYVLALMFSLVLINTSCEKPNDTPDPVVKTLEQTYPSWKNLKWEGTDNVFTTDKYPKLTITIVGDVVTITKKLNSTQSIIGKYSKMTAPSNTVTFSDVIGDFNGLGTPLTCTNVSETTVEVYLTCLSNAYVLQK